MDNMNFKHLIREALQEKEDLDLINSAISYLSKNDELSVNPGILLLSKSILCDKRRGGNKNYGDLNQDALELSKSAIKKCEEIKKMDPELFRTMVKDGSSRKYRKLFDIGHKIIIIGD